MAFKVGDIVKTKVDYRDYLAGSLATVIRVCNPGYVIVFQGSFVELHFDEHELELETPKLISNSLTFTVPAGSINFDPSTTVYNSYYGDYLGDWDYPAPEEDKPKVKCECGTSKTLEGNDDPQFHSTWCPVYKERK